MGRSGSTINFDTALSMAMPANFLTSVVNKEIETHFYYSSEKNVEYSMVPLAEYVKKDHLGNSGIVFGLDGLIHAKLQAYSKRIDYLRDCAKDDGYDLNVESKDDFWYFVKSAPHFSRGNLVLLENGNLRAEWNDSHGNRLGLEFLGDEELEFVIFRRDPATRQMSYAYGRGAFEEIKRQINIHDLYSMLRE